MNETIALTGFAGLPKIQLDLSEFNVLIGPQATGKSVIAKLLFYCKSVMWQVFAAAENKQTKRDLDRNLKKRFEEFFPPASWGANAFTIDYHYGDFFIKINRDPGKDGAFSIEYSKYLHVELNRLRRFFNSAESTPEFGDYYQQIQIVSQIRNHLVVDLVGRFGERSTASQIFIPAGRSFFANLQSSIFSFLSGNNAIDPFLKEFGSFYENIKRVGAPSQTRMAPENKAYFQDSAKLMQEILCGKYVNDKGKDYLDVIDGRRISLGNCSSGQQETLPLALMLRRLPLLRGRAGGHSVYIEEPEAHLFPMSQRLILELIALTFNASAPRLQIFITTHSPYVLTALNNLIQAGALYEKLAAAEQTKLAKVVSKGKAIAISKVAAYALSRTECKSIKDPETQLLSAELIDSVSADLAIEFDSLLDLQ